MGKLKYFDRIFFGLISLCIVILGGCSSSPNGEDHFIAEGEGERLASKILGIDSIAGYGFCYMVIGDKLIQYLMQDKYSYSVYDIKGDSLFYQGKFMIEGNGPYEMNIAKLKYRPDKNELIIYSEETYQNDFYTVDLNNFDNLYYPRSWKQGKLPTLLTRNCLEFVNDSVYLHSSFTKKNSLFSLSYKGEDNSGHSLNMPYPQTKEETNLVLQYTLFTGKLMRHLRKPTFLYSSDYSKYVILFDLDGTEITNVRYISNILPDYKPTGNHSDPLFTLNKESQNGCIKTYITEQYVYFGYNNLALKDIGNNTPFKGYPYYYFDRINVFDWNGKFIKRLVLDKPIYGFSVCEDDRYLYGSSVDLTKDDQPGQVLRFELKD